MILFPGKRGRRSITDSRRDPLLRSTDFLLTACLVLLAAAVVVLMVSVPVIWIARDAVIAELVRENPRVNEPMALPAITGVLAGAGVLLAFAWAFMRELRAVVRTVADGDPLTFVNAGRLTRMGWIAIAAQLIAAAIGVFARWVAEYVGTASTGWGVDFSGIVLVLVLFILARVFRQGAVMRADLEGTV